MKTKIEMRVIDLEEQVETLEKQVETLKKIMGKVQLGGKIQIPEEYIMPIIWFLNDTTDFDYERLGKENVLGVSDWNNDVKYGNISSILDFHFDNWELDGKILKYDDGKEHDLSDEMFDPYYAYEDDVYTRGYSND